MRSPHKDRITRMCVWVGECVVGGVNRHEIILSSLERVSQKFQASCWKVHLKTLKVIFLGANLKTSWLLKFPERCISEINS